MEKGIIFATVITDDNENKARFNNLCGAHFHQETDPTDPKNKVLMVYTHNTAFSLDSTTNISAKNVQNRAATCEFEMKYYFQALTWVFRPKYLTLDFRNKAGVRLFTLGFETEDFGEGHHANGIILRDARGNIIEGIKLRADCWHKLKFEYYFNDKSPAESRLKIYHATDGDALKLKVDMEYQGKTGVITKASLVHHATQIKGTQYFDDISFAITDKKYSKESVATPITDGRTVYNFESGIPSDTNFNIDMRLKQDDEIVSFDPVTVANGSKSAAFLHSNKFYEIMLVLSGECTLFTENEEYPLQTGSIALISPGCARGLTTKGEYKILSIAGIFDRLSFVDKICVLQDNIYNEGKKLAQMILYNRFGNEDYLNSLCDAYIKYILFNFDRPPMHNTTASIYKIIGEMEKRFGSSDLSVSSLLDESGYARNYIRAEFLSVTKMTPTKYFTSIRMKNAKAMLDLYGDDMSVNEIAERCGILDPSVFSRMFKKYYGVSPSKYKRKSKNSKDM